MGLFDIFKKKEKTDVEKYYEERQQTQNYTSPTQQSYFNPQGDNFQFLVDDIFTITGKGTVVTGGIKSGTISVGDSVNIVRNGMVVKSTTITGIEEFKKLLKTAQAGQNVGILLSEVRKKEIAKGDILTK